MLILWLSLFSHFFSLILLLIVDKGWQTLTLRFGYKPETQVEHRQLQVLPPSQLLLPTLCHCPSPPCQNLPSQCLTRPTPTQKKRARLVLELFLRGRSLLANVSPQRRLRIPVSVHSLTVTNTGEPLLTHTSRWSPKCMGFQGLWVRRGMLKIDSKNHKKNHKKYGKKSEVYLKTI